VLAEVIGYEDALDHKSDILLAGLGALPEVVGHRAGDEDDGLERDRAGVALEVVPGKGVSEVLEGCLIELPIFFVGDVLGLTVKQSEVIQVENLNVTHRVQRGVWLFS
jgi:hypothetical protein